MLQKEGAGAQKDAVSSRALSSFLGNSHNGESQ